VPGTLRERSPDPSALVLHVGALLRVRRVSAPPPSGGVPSRAIHLPERVLNYKGPSRDLSRGEHKRQVIKMKAAFYTLGCKANQFETQAMERLFVEKGHQLVDFSEKADVYVINTCTVTALADKKSRNAIRRAKSLNPLAKLFVCGCFAKIHPEQIQALGVDRVISSGERASVVEYAEDRLPAAPQPGFEILPAGGLAGRTRALMKVQDGCQNDCSYCIIPYARGKCRSLPLETALEETKRLRREGYCEIVVTGIEISSYGVDLPGRPTLARLTKGLCEAAEGVRIRLGSLEPRTVTEEFASSLAGLDNLCPHFHLSLQSGSDRVLQAMNRRYTAERYSQSCGTLRKYFPGCAVSTDLIVGFPGETEEDFEGSLRLIKACAITRTHIFPYSVRPGTKAASMPLQVSKEDKRKRCARATEVCAGLSSDYARTFAGKTVSVLFETEKNGISEGYTPEYCRVFVKSTGLHNQTRPVLVERADGEILIGRLADNE